MLDEGMNKFSASGGTIPPAGKALRMTDRRSKNATNHIIKNSDNGKLLGVTVYANLNFSCHLENILKKLSSHVSKNYTLHEHP